MSKEYGLINPKKNPSKFVRLPIFDSSDTSEEEKTTNKKINLTIGKSQQRQIEKAQENALEEDPTIFQYDELFDDIKKKRDNLKASKSKEVKSAKYIEKLMESAERRKKDYERHIERQVQKEREAEGETYKDKDSFVTTSYRLKLDEMKLAEEVEKRDAYLESIGDVTKQRDLGGFYRHLYEQKLGNDKAKPDTDKTPPVNTESKSSDRITNANIKKERTYRKRKSSDNEKSDDENKNQTERKKSHLQYNLDADSDFSIDSDSETECDKKEEKVDVNTEPDVFIKPEILDIKTEVIAEPNVHIDEKSKDEDIPVVNVTQPQNKISIWKKRTVDDVLDAAIQRYYERKILRESN